MSSRDFDLVLLGATGFTGRLVAEYLDVHAPDGVRIALAGRAPEKLEALRASLGARGRAFPILRADSHDDASLAALAQQAKVVCSTVGPYAKHGLPLVAACAKAGTHYADLTGEVQFMRDSIDAWDVEARRTGARIVHACGFDSIPSDAGAWLLHRALGPMRRATYVVESMKGGFSGGTVASLLNALEEATKDRARRRLMADPYALSPDRSKEPDLGRERDLTSFEYDDFAGRWVAPFIMAAINTRVVRRSNALLGYPYGRQFRYREVSGMPRGPRGAVLAAAMTGGMGAFMAGLSFGPTRALLTRLLPKPGEGPSEETRRTGRLRLRIFGEAEDGRRATALIVGQGDPGYQLTALILSQASLALAVDTSRLPDRAGVLTPITAMGDVLIDRLRAAGMTLSVEA
jgi:short subunit dehydrogenase-like uncharacterized protein